MDEIKTSWDELLINNFSINDSATKRISWFNKLQQNKLNHWTNCSIQLNTNKRKIENHELNRFDLITIDA